MEKLNVYIDASVFGGCFEREFDEASNAFMQGVMSGTALPVVSDTLIAELVRAPASVRQLLNRVMSGDCIRLSLSDQVERLGDAYIQAGVLTEKWTDDALHVAQAVVAGADVIVSWNFKHMVNPFRIKGFNEVNAALGYGPVVIMTPEDLCRIWEKTNDED